MGPTGQDSPDSFLIYRLTKKSATLLQEQFYFLLHHSIVNDRFSVLSPPLAPFNVEPWRLPVPESLIANPALFKQLGFPVKAPTKYLVLRHSRTTDTSQKLGSFNIFNKCLKVVALIISLALLIAKLLIVDNRDTI